MLLNPIISASGGLKPQIVVTAPTGSTVTCTTPSGIVIQGIESSGTWTFANLPGLGTYTINAALGSESKTKSVVVDRVGVFGVEIVYRLYLYNYGLEYTDITGGWGINGWTGVSGIPLYLGTKNEDSLYCRWSSGSYAFCTNEQIDATGYTTLYVKGKPTGVNDWAGLCVRLLDRKIRSNDYLLSLHSLVSLGTDTTERTVSIPLNWGKQFYICLDVDWTSPCKGYYYQVWLE